MKKQIPSSILFLFLFLFPSALFTACTSAVDSDFHQAASHIKAENMAGYIEVLASDEFMGRMPFTHGEELTINYLKEVYLELGLEPAWHGSFFQDVHLVEVAVKPDRNMHFHTPEGPLSLEYVTDFVSFSPRVENVARVADARLVFAGYGISAPELGWDDYAGLDVSDKIVVVIVNDPGFATGDPELFNGHAMTYYGRWTYKFEEAARQGTHRGLDHHRRGRQAVRTCRYGFPAAQGGGLSKGVPAGPHARATAKL